MTASIVGMEQGREDIHNKQALVGACLYCTNAYCQGPLPGYACTRVGRHIFMQPHDMPSWKRLSGEGKYSINNGARRD